MAKSFKKVIACLLAVLMVLFSVPFTALANPVDYKPDVNVRFGTLTRDYYNYTPDLSSGTWGTKDLHATSACGIYGPTLDYTGGVNEETGALEITKLSLDVTKAGPAIYVYNEEITDPSEFESYAAENYAGELQTDLTTGMGFTMTWSVANIEELATLTGYFTYSDNVEPAYIYNSGTTNKNTVAKIGTKADYDADTTKNKKLITAAQIPNQDANNFYGTLNTTEVTTCEGGKIFLGAASDTGEAVAIANYDSVNGDDAVVNPTTGELGYDFDHNSILITLGFIITGEISETSPLVIGFDGDKADSVTLSCAKTGNDLNDIDHSNYGYYEGSQCNTNMYFMNYNANSKQYLNGSVEPKEHVHTYDAVHTDATCTVNGYTTYTCNNSDGLGTAGDDSYVEQDDPATTLGHDIVTDAAVPATCTTTGLTEGSHCSRCDEATVAQEEIPALGHNYGEWVTTKEATETETGLKRRDCSRCDAYEEETIPKKEHVHNFVAGDVVAPTCTAQGYTVYTCACGETENRDFKDALGHDIVTDAAVAATCTKPGLTEGSHCSRCDEATVAQVETPALGHDIVTDAAVEATCTTPGLTEGSHCSRCDEATVAQEEIPALGHDYGEWVTTKEATEEEDGLKRRDCSRCDAFEEDIIPALGHTHVYTETYTAATCTKAGYTTYTCKCGDTYDEVDVNAPALGHDIVTDAAVAATCTKTGLTEGSHCSRCDEATVAQVETPALGHDIVTDAAVAATCTKTGLTEGSHCSRCDEATVAQVETPALGHDIVIDAAVAPTLESTGLTEGSHCSRCDEATVPQEVIPALEGVDITLADTYASFGDVTGLAIGATTKVVKGSDVTLTAAPAGGCEFVGWQVDKKILSTDATYKFTAYTDATITPIFVDSEAAAGKITVVFYDCYMNVTAAYTDVTVDEFQAAMAAGIPVGTTYAGKVFNGWSMSEADIKALNHSATIEANYTDAVNAGYTVKATDGAVFEDGSAEMTGVKYDTQVTVSAENAKAWKINDVVVAYGPTYTFYVGSDVTVTPVFDDSVVAKPEVAMVSVDRIEGSHKVAFLATMSAPDGYTIIDHGFVYGKAATDAELRLENVGNTIAASGTKVKSAALTVNSANQFALNYGLTAKSGTATVVAYITYKDAAGQITTVYTNVADGTYTY